MVLHLFQVEIESKFNIDMASEVHKWNSDECLRLFTNTHMGSKWIALGRFRQYFSSETE